MRDAGRFLAPTPSSNFACAALSRRSPQIVRVGALNFDRDDVAGAQGPARRDVHGAVDLRRVALAAPLRLARAAIVDDDLKALADLGGEFLRADRLARAA